jgi:acyl-lipid omega-6 desaturase (Delta-12 desaturase)
MDQSWNRTLASYRGASPGRSFAELLVTAAPFIALWVCAWVALNVGYWLSLLLAIPTAGFLVRLFMIQHDCGHGSFFLQRWANDWLGRVIGIFTLTPYGFWRRTHAIHHASSGNLGRRGIGDVDTLTVSEYLSLPRSRRLRYRLYRNPFVLFGLGPAYLFLFRHRVPAGLMRAGWGPWISTMANNLWIALAAALMMWMVGIGPFLLVHIPIVLLGAAVGMWLFFVQHQFDDTHWADHAEWNFQRSALHGSSHYDLPLVLRWFTANIGVHHVHHLCSVIPFYRLPDVLRDHPQLHSVGRLTLVESFRCARLALWDECENRLVSFKEVATGTRALAAGAP